MSLLSRFFGRSDGNPYTQGVALYEEGRYAEAIEFLRVASKKQSSSPTGSLALFHLRQALVGEGRHLLRVGRPAEALPYLTEAAGAWDAFPDLQFLVGATHGLTGDWDTALQTAHAALRLNPDYCEARLLEACSFIHLSRTREAAASLNKLLEAGRRSSSPLVAALAREGGYHEGNLPLDLPARLEKAAGGQMEDGNVASAVALCRSGHWERGLTQLKQLVVDHSSYPDYRVKLAAAFFQVGKAEKALLEVDEALRLNPSYRTAGYLKSLILADQYRLESAREVLNAILSTEPSRNLRNHEEMFAAFLGGVLDLLTGRLVEAEQRLAPWGDLTHSFPRAAVLRAAVADLDGRPAVAAEFLKATVEAWPADAEYLFLLACHHLRHGALADVEKELAQWPASDLEFPDERPLRLNALLALERGQVPDIPVADSDGKLAPAWRFLVARKLANQGKWSDCWREASALWQEGHHTAPVAHLLSEAAVHLAGTPGLPDDWQPPEVVPASVLTLGVYLGHRQDRKDQVERRLELHHSLHPEDNRWSWLTPAFWLNPIRRWIG